MWCKRGALALHLACFDSCRFIVSDGMLSDITAYREQDVFFFKALYLMKGHKQSQQMCKFLESSTSIISCCLATHGLSGWGICPLRVSFLSDQYSEVKVRSVQKETDG